MFDCNNSITCNTTKRLFIFLLFFSKERNASNKNDQYIIYFELCLLSLSYKRERETDRQTEGQRSGHTSYKCCHKSVQGKGVCVYVCVCVVGGGGYPTSGSRPKYNAAAARMKTKTQKVKTPKTKSGAHVQLEAYS